MVRPCAMAILAMLEYARERSSHARAGCPWYVLVPWPSWPCSSASGDARVPGTGRMPVARPMHVLCTSYGILLPTHFQFFSPARTGFKSTYST